MLSKERNNKNYLTHITILLYILKIVAFDFSILLLSFIMVFYLIVYNDKIFKIKLNYDNRFVQLMVKFFTYFSNISYCLYLLHQNIGFSIIYNLEELGFTSEFVIIIPFIVSVLLATVIHYLVAVPSSKLLLKINPFNKNKIKA